MKLLRLILIAIIIYYVARILIRIIFPYLFNSSRRKHHSGHKKKREGNITIDYINKKEKKYNKDEGEYIDFKEIE
jgi:hypothetical protein